MELFSDHTKAKISCPHQKIPNPFFSSFTRIIIAIWQIPSKIRNVLGKSSAFCSPLDLTHLLVYFFKSELRTTFEHFNRGAAYSGRYCHRCKKNSLHLASKIYKTILTPDPPLPLLSPFFQKQTSISAIHQRKSTVD